MLDIVVISGDNVCCIVVFGTLVGVFVFSIMWSELLMTSAISCPLWSSAYECQRVDCAFTTPMRNECGLLYLPYQKIFHLEAQPTHSWTVLEILFFFQYITEPTRFREGQNPIDDLVFTNESEMFEQLKYLDPPGAGGSDHAAHKRHSILWKKVYTRQLSYAYHQKSLLMLVASNHCG